MNLGNPAITTKEGTKSVDIREIVEKTNIAEDLDEDTLIKIGDEVVKGYDTDLASRVEWDKECDQWTELALQVAEKKTFPWPNASNVKYPLVSVAAMQFAARAYPSLIPSDGVVVRCRTVGADPDGEKQARAKRISKHMSYQLLEEMEDWEGDMDRLLVILPIIGMAYKKTFYCPIKKRNVSNLVLPKDLVVNYWCKSVEEAERKTEVLWKTKRDIKEKQLNNIYLSDVELGDPSQELGGQNVGSSAMAPTGIDETTPYCVLEQHGYWDLDGDGYAEPYVFTVEKATKTVLRIAARFTPEDISTNEKGDIISIKAIEYYTQYDCIPNPDGSGYSIGFGKLLGSINHSVDTIINQLIDSGTLQNLQSGFIGKGLRIKMQETRFQPGEWKAVNATGDDLKKQILPIPINQPSPVLFQLLGMLIQSGKELASVAEIFVGKMPGQNTPAYTTKETVEQGMKLFTAIYKRVFRSMKREFQKIYDLNRIYLDPQQEIEVIDEPIQQSDYEGPANDIIPAADPSAASKTEREYQAQALAQLIPLGAPPPVVLRRILESMEIPKMEELLPQGPPPPSPEEQKMKMEMQMKQQEHQAKMQMEQLKLQVEQMKAQMELQVKKLDMMLEMQKSQMEMEVSSQEHELSLKQQEEQARMDQMTGMMDHQQKMKQGEESHQMKMKQQKNVNKNKKTIDKD